MPVQNIWNYVGDYKVASCYADDDVEKNFFVLYLGKYCNCSYKP
jgi:hypothetical protein